MKKEGTKELHFVCALGLFRSMLLISPLPHEVKIFRNMLPLGNILWAMVILCDLVNQSLHVLSRKDGNEMRS